MTTSATTAPNGKIMQVIGSIRNLPTPPIVFQQIQKVISNPDTSVADVASILSEDPAMSVKVLKLTNSAFYGLQREIDSVKHAVMIIGLEAVKNLVLSASVLNMFKSNVGNREYHEVFWRHSLATAFGSRVIARQFQDGKIFNPDPAFSSGLIHDIGKMVICCFLSEQHSKITEYMEQNSDKSELEAENEILGFDHAQLGRELMIQWKLPERMADAIGYHHAPDQPNASEDFAYLINLADYISHMGTVEGNVDKGRFHASEKTLAFFDYDEDQLESLNQHLTEEYSKAETFMNIAGL
jgi:HD-like signal output (HDOD) protein